MRLDKLPSVETAQRQIQSFNLMLCVAGSSHSSRIFIRDCDAAGRKLDSSTD